MLPADAPSRQAREMIKDYAVRLAASGMVPRDLASLIGWQVSSVSQLLSRARKAGAAVPRFRPGRVPSGRSA